jgi:hypothetical protein
MLFKKELTEHSDSFALPSLLAISFSSEHPSAFTPPLNRAAPAGLSPTPSAPASMFVTFAVALVLGHAAVSKDRTSSA